MIDKISVKDLSVPKMQISFDSNIILPNVGEATANRWGLKIIRSILSKGVFFPEIKRITYVVEIRPQAEFFGVFDPEELIDELKFASELYAQEKMKPILEFA